MVRFLTLLLLSLLAMAACNAVDTPSSSLPLAENKPTVLFFFTES